MTWDDVIGAMDGRPEALNRILRHVHDSCNDDAAQDALLLLDDAPHPAAALVAAVTSWEEIAALTSAALAPQIDAALAAWRADPLWAERAIGAEARKRLMDGVPRLAGALRDRPAALRDAVAILVRDGDARDVARGLDEIGAAGWRALADDQRAALLARTDASSLGWDWMTLDETQRATATQEAAGASDVAARLIGRIGAAAWQATNSALRARLIAAAVRGPFGVSDTAPAWPGMTDAERERLIAATPALGAANAIGLLESLGVAGRASLTAAQRATIEARAKSNYAWRVRLLQIADAGWDAVSAAKRTAAIAEAEEDGRKTPQLLRIVGAAGWSAMRADERARLAAAVRTVPHAIFFCPPTLWRSLADGSLPSATTIPWIATRQWRAEDADADLGGLPPAHQALVLARAPWRPEDAAKDSVRVRRLRAAWDALPDDERAALATAHPSVLAFVAAAARLGGGGDAAGETLARLAAATCGAGAKREVGAMLGASGDWRPWMRVFAPTDADPPDVWESWLAAVQRGYVSDLSLCARLAALNISAASRAQRRR